jgi:hypothetical protein
MSPQEIHARQVRMVHESMLLADDRKDRHNVTRLSAFRPCQKCHAPHSFHACATCDRPAAA